MPGLLGCLVWLAGPAIQGYIVVRSLARKELSLYPAINLYMFSACLSTLLQLSVYRLYGFTSSQYFYCYYWGDSLLIIPLYFAVMSLYEYVFREMGLRTQIRGAFLLLLFATGLFSCVLAYYQNPHLAAQFNARVATRFFVNVSQNLYFVGLLLTYLLWMAVRKLEETRLRLVQLVLALGIYFSACAAIYALRNLFPDLALTKGLTPVVNLWLPVAWAYTFTRVPEQAVTAPARLAHAGMESR